MHQSERPEPRRIDKLLEHLRLFLILVHGSGYTRLADVERWATRIGLPFERCRGGIWSTEDAANCALGVRDDMATALYPGDVV